MEWMTVPVYLDAKSIIQMNEKEDLENLELSSGEEDWDQRICNGIDSVFEIKNHLVKKESPREDDEPETVESSFAASVDESLDEESPERKSAVRVLEFDETREESYSPEERIQDENEVAQVLVSTLSIIRPPAQTLARLDSERMEPIFYRDENSDYDTFVQDESAVKSSRKTLKRKIQKMSPRSSLRKNGKSKSPKEKISETPKWKSLATVVNIEDTEHENPNDVTLIGSRTKYIDPRIKVVRISRELPDFLQNIGEKNVERNMYKIVDRSEIEKDQISPRKKRKDLHKENSFDERITTDPVKIFAPDGQTRSGRKIQTPGAFWL